MRGSKADHFATWAGSFAAASLAVWCTWTAYLNMDLRFRAPNWLLVNEGLLFGGLFVALLFGMLVTAYQTRLFVREDETSPNHRGTRADAS